MTPIPSLSPAWQRRILPRPPRRLSWPRRTVCLLAGLALYCTLSSAAGQAEPSATDSARHFAQVEQAEAEQFKAAIQNMAAALVAHLGDPDPGLGDLGEGLVVASFVELKKLRRTSSFGRYLAEQLMTEFQQRGYRVVDIRKANGIQVQEGRGEYGLSRDPAEIKPSVAARAMITGTYTVTDDSILVNAKVLDNKSASLLTSATMVFPRTRTANQLLADAASATPPPGAQGETTMKRLDL